jgi:hypothetical protein
MSLVSYVRSCLLPWCTGKNGTFGSDVAQRFRCKILDVFFQYFPLLGCADHYAICIPLVNWLCGDTFALNLYVSLAVVFFLVNAAKDILTLPRPMGNMKLETLYLEEFGFPSTHTAASVVWATCLCKVLKECGVRRELVVLSSVGYVILIMFCRLYLGVHCLIDLIGGFQIGFMTVMLTEYILTPLIQYVVLDADASVKYSLIFWDFTVDGVVVVVIVMGGMILLFPDKRPARSSYGDVVSMVGHTMGATLIIGGHIRDGALVPFGHLWPITSDNYFSFAVGLVLNYLLMGVLDVVGSLVRNHLESIVGFQGGVFRFGKSFINGMAVSLLAFESIGLRLNLIQKY